MTDRTLTIPEGSFAILVKVPAGVSEKDARAKVGGAIGKIVAELKKSKKEKTQ